MKKFKTIKRFLIKISSLVLPINLSLLAAKFLLVSQGIGFAVEVEDSGELKSLCKIVKNKYPVIFDVGGNIGKYSSGALKYFPNAMIHVFEPSLIHCKKITENLQDYSNQVFINSYGLSSKSDALIIHKDKSITGSATLCDSDVFNDFQLTELINVIRGDDYVISNNINHIDYMKIDVEGWELEVLLGFGKYINTNFCKAIQFEITNKHLSRRESIHDFINFFSSRNYDLYLIRTNGNKYKISLNMEIFENYYPTNFLALPKEPI